MKTHRKDLIPIACIFLLVLSVAGIALGAARHATLSSLKGSVIVKQDNKSYWVPGRKGMWLRQGDILKTKKDSRALVSVSGESENVTITVSPESQIMFTELAGKKGQYRTLLDVGIGRIEINTTGQRAKDSIFQVKTPTSLVDVDRATFIVEVGATD